MPTQIARSLTMRANKLIEERTGIATYTQLQGSLDDLLATLAPQGNILAYLDQLKDAPESAPIWQPLINELTVGETYFFRDRSHFHILRSYILPELIKKRRAEDMLHLSIWSVGCATGEEPYSLAITLHQLLPDIAKWSIRLIGTDINADALHTARRGVYRKWAFRHTDPEFQDNYFDQDPGGLQIKPHIRRIVSFRHDNLFNKITQPQYDLILCRNVLLYFSNARKFQAESLFFDALTSGGWLLLGHAETLRYQPEQWVTHLFPGTPAYQKPGQAHKVEPGKPVVKKHTRTFPKVRDEDAKNGAHRRITYEDAVSAIQQEAYEKAEELLSDLLAAQPDHASAHTLLAHIYANRNHITRAHSQIETALEIDPLLANAHYLQGLLFLEEDRTQDAFQALNAALYCQRNHPLASFMLGNLYAQAGELVKANRYWENTHAAIDSLTPDSPVCDISHITAGQLEALVSEQLEGWQT